MVVYVACDHWRNLISGSRRSVLYGARGHSELYIQEQPRNARSLCGRARSHWPADEGLHDTTCPPRWSLTLHTCLFWWPLNFCRLSRANPLPLNLVPNTTPSSPSLVSSTINHVTISNLIYLDFNQFDK